MNIHLNGITYIYQKDFKHIDELRAGYNSLAEICFDFNFEDWYQKGYWTDNYIPYAIFHNGKLVSNASANVMDLDFNGTKKIYVQIGTVMTHPEYRGLGLARYLLEKIIEEWEHTTNLIFLYANETVLDFYPRFGFKRAEEYEFKRKIESQPIYTLSKVDMSNALEREKIIAKIQKSKPISYPMLKNDIGLIMFYLISFFKDNVYYLKEKDAYVIAQTDKDTYYLQDLYCEESLDISDFPELFVPTSAKYLRLGFTPLDTSNFESSKFLSDDLGFFLRGKDESFIKNNKMMFPLLAHT